ncbi:nucleolar protein 12 isoform 5 [Mus musculus]|nr:nucleolar protein 12 isoform 5 [Mus musculus]
MLAEREEALEEADELERLVTAKTESVQYDHPNHTVTVTTISDLDLSGARLLGLPLPEQGDQDGSQEEEMSSLEKPTKALPRKSKDPLLSQRYTARTQSEEGQEETPSAGTGLHQETSKCHTYQQDPAPPSDDWKSQAQRGVSPQTWGSQLESLAVPVTQLHRGLPAA